MQAHLAVPVVEQPPLGAVDTAGVVGEDGLQGVGDALVGGALAGYDLRVAGGGGHGRVSGGGFSRRFRRAKDAR